MRCQIDGRRTCIGCGVCLTQGERSRIIKKLLKWMEKHDEKGVSVSAIYAYVTMEITEMGATKRTAKTYLAACENACLVVPVKASRWKITAAGKAWLRRHPD